MVLPALSASQDACSPCALWSKKITQALKQRARSLVGILTYCLHSPCTKFLIQSLPLSKMNRGNYSTAMDWAWYSKVSRAEKPVCSKESWWMWKLRSENDIAAALHITHGKWKLPCLEAGKVLTLQCLFLLVRQSHTEPFALPVESGTINEAGEKPVVIYCFKMNWEYWLFFPFLKTRLSWYNEQLH